MSLEALQELFLGLFGGPADLRLHVLLKHPELEPDLPLEGISSRQYSAAVLQLLGRRGYLDPAFFAGLTSRFPRRSADISSAARLLLGDPDSVALSTEVRLPEQVFETPDDQRAVSHSPRQHKPGRPHTASARTLAIDESPRIGTLESSLSQWNALCQCIHEGRFLPIVGPDLDEGLFGGVRGLAKRLATKHAFPNADHEHTDLAKVVQFLSIQKDRAFAYKAVQAELIEALLERQENISGDHIKELPKLLDIIIERRRALQDDPYRALARLPASIYLTASPETLLFKVVKAAGRSPEALVCRWRSTRTNTPREPRIQHPPSPDAPLIHHVFGVFGVPESLVLTEDDLFDFLIATSTYKLLPAIVRSSLTDSALLFLGFRLDDWTFRVLFRMVMNLEGSAGMRKYSHVGVQINPKEHSLADIARARLYLERYFGSDRGAGLSEPPITLYWGTPAGFLAELERRLEETRKEEILPSLAEGADEWF